MPWDSLGFKAKVLPWDSWGSELKFCLGILHGRRFFLLRDSLGILASEVVLLRDSQGSVTVVLLRDSLGIRASEAVLLRNP